MTLVNYHCLNACIKSPLLPTKVWLHRVQGVIGLKGGILGQGCYRIVMRGVVSEMEINILKSRTWKQRNDYMGSVNGPICLEDFF